MYHVYHSSLHLHVLRENDQIFVLPVVRLEPHVLPLSVEPFYRHLLAVSQESHDYRPVRRVLVLLHYQKVPVLDPRPHHALTHYPQEVTPSSRTGQKKLGRQRVRLVTQGHSFEPPAGGYPSQQGRLTVQNGSPALLREPWRPGPVVQPLHVPVPFEPPQMMVNGLRALQAHGHTDLADARRPTRLRFVTGQELEDLQPLRV